jgi:hypothetical protein
VGKIISYVHHGCLVSVDEDLVGKHYQHCLCYRCGLFTPGQKKNCRIAQENYKLCIKENLVLPVYECPVFEEGTPDFSKMI